jgi:Rab5 GDP/GTP exchange factor
MIHFSNLKLTNNLNFFTKALQLPPKAEVSIKYALKSVDIDVDHKFRNAESDTDIQKIADTIQSSYATFVQLMNGEKSAFDYLDQIQKEIVLDTFERCIMGRIYLKVFSTDMDTDEDDDFCTRWKVLKGLCPEKNLGIPLSVYDTDARKMVFEAVNVLVSIDPLLVPEEKIGCIVNCCRVIGEYFKRSRSKVVGADDLLPALIFVVLQANCYHLYSNINYIRRFRVRDKIEMSEGGYFFVLLVSERQCEDTNAKI